MVEGAVLYHRDVCLADLVTLNAVAPTNSHGVSYHGGPLVGIKLSHRFRPGGFEGRL